MIDTTQLEFGCLRSSVVVDGSDVRHYEVQYDEGAKTATSWIVSEPDKPFSILLKLVNRIPGENYTLEVLLDGHRATKFVITADRASPVAHVKSTRVSPSETRRFMFGSLELSDDDALLEASSTEALGEIRILLYRTGTLLLSKNHDNKKYLSPPEAQKVHERSKKGLAHSVKYGGTRLNPLSPAENLYICSGNTLTASHTIRYRPLAMLQANGIVPYVSTNDGQNNTSKSPSPAPGPSSDRNSRKRKALREADEADVKPVINLDDDDYRDILRKEHELQEQLTQLQEKKAQHQDRQAKKIKQEEMKPILHGEIIDLTI